MLRIKKATATRQSRRGTNALAGYVAFPVESVDYPSTREGGMFVKLVVVDPREWLDSDWNICCGATVVEQLSASLVGDDQAPRPVPTFTEEATPEETVAALDAHEAADRAWQARHFPHLHDAEVESRFCSTPYVAVMLLGITGWSGYSTTKSDYWCCTFDDLTEAGKAFYRSAQQLYPGCQLHLLTFLDS